MKKDNWKYLIIGNSVTAIAAAEAIRSHDQTGAIALVSDETYPAYSRPLLTYFLSGEVDAERMSYRQEDYYRCNELTTILGSKAVILFPQEKKVVLENGRELHYDRLLLATGGTPIVPQIEGRELGGMFSLTRWEDALRIRDFLKNRQAKKAVVVGGGLIGLKVTEALVQMGVKVKIVELSDRILGATFDQRASELLRAHIEEAGVETIMENTVSGIEGEEVVCGVTLRDGTVIDTQLVIFAVGVKPNAVLAREAGIEVNKGIIVDARLGTSVPDIYAAGDVAEGWDALLHICRPLPIWPVAHRQGSIAGHNMADCHKIYRGGFPMNSAEICGLSTVSAGITYPCEDGYEILQSYCPSGKQYRKIVLSDNRVVGAILIGNIDRAGILIGLIRAGIDVVSFKDRLVSEDFGLLWLPKNYRKHITEGPGIEV